MRTVTYFCAKVMDATMKHESKTQNIFHWFKPKKEQQETRMKLIAPCVMNTNTLREEGTQRVDKVKSWGVLEYLGFSKLVNPSEGNGK